MKDCFDRWSLPTCEEAHSFCRWLAQRAGFRQIPFHCHRCGRWHIANSRDQALECRRKMQRERCLSDRDLHLQLARVTGMSLDELQTRADLSKVRLNGPGVEVITPRRAAGQLPTEGGMNEPD